MINPSMLTFVIFKYVGKTKGNDEKLPKKDRKSSSGWRRLVCGWEADGKEGDGNSFEGLQLNHHSCF